MADFCFDCTGQYFGEEYAPQNDFVGRAGKLIGTEEDGAGVPVDPAALGEGVAILGLCEGCGFHFFTNDGRRLCRSGETDPTTVSDEICEDCKNTEVVDARAT